MFANLPLYFLLNISPGFLMHCKQFWSIKYFGFQTSFHKIPQKAKYAGHNNRIWLKGLCTFKFMIVCTHAKIYMCGKLKIILSTQHTSKIVCLSLWYWSVPTKEDKSSEKGSSSSDFVICKQYLKVTLSLFSSAHVLIDARKNYKIVTFNSKRIL